jgi:hypothetical protein
MATQRKISADLQRLIADQLSWVNVTGYSFFQAYRDHGKNDPCCNAVLVLLATTGIVQ